MGRPDSLGFLVKDFSRQSNLTNEWDVVWVYTEKQSKRKAIQVCFGKTTLRDGNFYTPLNNLNVERLAFSDAHVELILADKNITVDGHSVTNEYENWFDVLLYNEEDFGYIFRRIGNDVRRTMSKIDFTQQKDRSNKPIAEKVHSTADLRKQVCKTVGNKGKQKSSSDSKKVKAKTSSTSMQDHNPAGVSLGT